MFRRFNFVYSPLEDAETATGGAAPDNSFAEIDPNILSELGLNADGLKADQPLDAESSEQDKGEVDNLSPEQIVEKMAGENPGQTGDQPLNAESEILSQVNALGLKHEGGTFNVESKEQLVEYLQKGRDYTLNSQKLTQERQQIESLLEQRISDYEKNLVENQKFYENAEKFDYALQKMQVSDPDLYQQVIDFADGAQREINNPYVQSMAKRLEALERSHKEGQENLENKQIETQWSKDWATSAGDFEKVTKSLGINLDPKKVQAEWAKSDSTDVKSAFYAVYGDEIRKRYAAKVQLDTAKKKAEAVKTGKGVAGSTATGKTQEKLNLKGLDDEQRVFAIARSLTA